MEARQAAEARQQVTALYRAHALGLVKLAVLMVGDQPTAEDMVQDAFLDRTGLSISRLSTPRQ
jgi:DNA-directed RNA polymerase specialized sigma24 family protein